MGKLIRLRKISGFELNLTEKRSKIKMSQKEIVVNFIYMLRKTKNFWPQWEIAQFKAIS